MATKLKQPLVFFQGGRDYQVSDENFELWKVFYLIQSSTPEEKAKALENMKRLDPLNPDLTAL
jgi:hypothetical protein